MKDHDLPIEFAGKEPSGDLAFFLMAAVCIVCVIGISFAAGYVSGKAGW